jgi:Rieske Fe-S protein
MSDDSLTIDLRIMDYAAGCTHPGCTVRFAPLEARHVSAELLDCGFPVAEVCPAHRPPALEESQR